MRRAAAQHQAAHAALLGLQQRGVVDGVDHHQHGDVLAAGIQRLHHGRQRGRLRFAGDDGDVERAAQQGGQFGIGFRARCAHGDAGIAQAAGDGLGGFDTVVDDQQPQHAVLFDSHPSLS